MGDATDLTILLNETPIKHAVNDIVLYTETAPQENIAQVEKLDEENYVNENTTVLDYPQLRIYNGNILNKDPTTSDVNDNATVNDASMPILMRICKQWLTT
jgi:hypothetical protein